MGWGGLKVGQKKGFKSGLEGRNFPHWSDDEDCFCQMVWVWYDKWGRLSDHHRCQIVRKMRTLEGRDLSPSSSLIRRWGLLLANGASLISSQQWSNEDDYRIWSDVRWWGRWGSGTQLFLPNGASLKISNQEEWDTMMMLMRMMMTPAHDYLQNQRGDGAAMVKGWWKGSIERKSGDELRLISSNQLKISINGHWCIISIIVAAVKNRRLWKWEWKGYIGRKSGDESRLILNL